MIKEEDPLSSTNLTGHTDLTFSPVFQSDGEPAVGNVCEWTVVSNSQKGQHQLQLQATPLLVLQTKAEADQGSTCCRRTSTHSHAGFQQVVVTLMRKGDDEGEPVYT